MKTPGIAEKVFMPSPNSLIDFSETATSIVPLDSVTLALEDELNKVEAVSQSIPISRLQSTYIDMKDPKKYQCIN